MTPDQVKREAENVSSRMEAVYDAMVARHFANVAAMGAVTALARGGYFNSESNPEWLQ